MKLIIKFTLYFLVMIGPVMGGIFNPQVKTLENGLQLIVIPNSMALLLLWVFFIKVGTADDPISMIGLSHFLEHMMFKGTTSIPSAHFKNYS